MKSMLAIAICLSFITQTAMAAQDHNSSRSNKTASIAADLSDLGNDFSRDIVSADSEEYIQGRKIMDEVSDMEGKVETLKSSMTIGIFVNLLLKEAQELRCKSLEDKACIDLAIQEAEKKALRKVKHDTAKNSVGNIR